MRRRPGPASVPETYEPTTGMGWRVFISLVLGFAALGNGVASASDPYEILFPVAGENSYSDTFGDPRPGGQTHEGVDILAEKMTPVVAAADGVVGWVHDEQGGDCCAMQLLHSDGYSSWYIHLNNDTPGTDDGLGWGFAPGVTTGVAVSAGQIIGYVGDSGNAEAAPSHLHFELRDPSGVAFDPYPSLLAARLVDPTAADEILFYRADGLFKYYDLLPGGLIGAPINSGTGYTSGWSTIADIDLEGDGQDEIFFYRDDGLFKYYNILPGGVIGAPIKSGTGYTPGWSTIAAIDLDGDGQDEIFFYRTDGLFKYYDLLPDGTIGAPIMSGTGYTTDWSTIAPLDLDGDGQDEILFYRDDGLFKYYDVL
ncbi:MAG TPA: VCBS repeat domain-containing M23 family metallopeptidase, partial [Acidimicrobiia bacterium]